MTLVSSDFVTLPVSVLSGGERRLEAETYLSGGYGIRMQIEARLRFERFRKLAAVWQPSRLKSTLVDPEDGLPYLTATQVFDVRPVARKWVASSKIRDLDQLFVEAGWIVVTRSGSVGDALITFTPHVEKVISDDLLRVEVRRSEDRGRVYAFLRSKYGRMMVRSSKYGSVVKHLECDHLREIPVPVIPAALRKTLTSEIDKVFELRDRAYAATLEAEQLYGQRFGTVARGVASEMGYTCRAAEMFYRQRRLDARHYDPQTMSVLSALANSKVRTAPLVKVSTDIFGVPRFKHVYQEEGIAYLDSEDLFKLNPEITKFIPSVTKKDASLYYVERGWVLMACSGQLYGLNGSVVLADAWQEKKIVSNHVVRIVPKDIRPGYLAMVLGHPDLGRPLVQRAAFGSEVPEIAPEGLKSVPVPRLGSGEEAIADLVEGACAMRAEADSKEDAAVRSLESHLERSLMATS